MNPRRDGPVEEEMRKEPTVESARDVVERYHAAFDAHRDGWSPRAFAKAFGSPA